MSTILRLAGQKKKCYEFDFYAYYVRTCICFDSSRGRPHYTLNTKKFLASLVEVRRHIRGGGRLISAYPRKRRSPPNKLRLWGIMYLASTPNPDLWLGCGWSFLCGAMLFRKQRETRKNLSTYKSCILLEWYYARLDRSTVSKDERLCETNVSPHIRISLRA